MAIGGFLASPVFLSLVFIAKNPLSPSLFADSLLPSFSSVHGWTEHVVLGSANQSFLLSVHDFAGANGKGDGTKPVNWNLEGVRLGAVVATLPGESLCAKGAKAEKAGGGQRDKVGCSDCI